MPIRFRCHYCSQYLGISRTKVGQVVDCPRCGRSIRVPARDGRAEPASAPRLDLADPHLAQAMDALAALHRPENRPEESTDDADAPRPGEAADQVREADVSPVPVVIDMPPLSAPVVREVEPIDSPRPPLDVAESADPNTYSEEIARLARQAEAAAEDRPDPSRARQSSGWQALLTPVVLLTVTAATLAGFTVGFVAAPRGTANAPPTRTDGTTDTPGSAGGAPAPSGHEAGDEAARTAIAAVESDGASGGVVLPGRVTYEAAGTTRPDAEARVLALPETREGTLPLPALSLLQSPGGPDWRIGAEGVRIAGGQVALAGADGGFKLPLPAPGRYWVVILSQHQPAGAGRAAEPAVLKLLGEYFDRPLLLVGKRAYHVESVLVSGEEPTRSIQHRFPEDG